MPYATPPAMASTTTTTLVSAPLSSSGSLSQIAQSIHRLSPSQTNNSAVIKHPSQVLRNYQLHHHTTISPNQHDHHSQPPAADQPQPFQRQSHLHSGSSSPHDPPPTTSSTPSEPTPSSPSSSPPQPSPPPPSQPASTSPSTSPSTLDPHPSLNNPKSNPSLIYVAPARMMTDTAINNPPTPSLLLTHPSFPPSSSTKLTLPTSKSTSSSSSSISTFQFPLVNFSSPTPPPLNDRSEYFDQFPSSTYPSKTTRPLHQKTQSETAMKLELPNRLPSHLDTMPMLRKKSGEIVRPSLKFNSTNTITTPAYAQNVSRSSNLYSSSRSAPSTPISGPKAVHFDAHLEHVRHFLSQQRPIAVSRDGSPIETETEGEEEYPFPDMSRYDQDFHHHHQQQQQQQQQQLHPPRRSYPSRHHSSRTKLVVELINMPKVQSTDQMVCLKSIELAPDTKNLKGIVRVQNIAFEKCVAVRFTFDRWQTVSEVTADYLSSAQIPSTSSSSPGRQLQSIDLFGFTIKLQDVLARIEERQMEVAVRYLAAGAEYWDNNSNSNYHIRFKHLRLDDHPKPSSSPQNRLQHQHQHQQIQSRPQPPSQPSPSSQQLVSNKIPPSISRPMNRAQTTSSSPKFIKDTCPWAITLRAELDRLVGDDLGVSMANDDDGVKRKKDHYRSSCFDGGIGAMTTTTTTTTTTPITPTTTTTAARLDALSAVNQLKAGTGLSARYDFGLSLKQAASNAKSSWNRAKRFESSLPFSISPVPIEWLGVIPSGNNNTTAINTSTSTSPSTTPTANADTNTSTPTPTTITSSTILPSMIRDSPVDLTTEASRLKNVDPANPPSSKPINQDSTIKFYSGPIVGFKPWIPSGIVNLPPSPPQDHSPSMSLTTDHDIPLGLSSSSHQKNLCNHHGQIDHVSTIQASHSSFASPPRSFSPSNSLIHTSNFNDHSRLNHRQPARDTQFHHRFHHPCPTGLVGPQSPSLTDDSL